MIISFIFSFVATFKKCAPTPCWTAANFHLFGVEADDYLFADGFIGFDNFCSGPGLDRNFCCCCYFHYAIHFSVLKKNAACILPGMVSHVGDLQNCIQGIDYNHIQNMKCP
jgi:hypothetical protein